MGDVDEMVAWLRDVAWRATDPHRVPLLRARQHIGVTPRLTTRDLAVGLEPYFHALTGNVANRTYRQ